MQIPLEQIIGVCLREVKSRIGTLAISFIVISVAVILIGSNWPRLYESSTTILADQGKLTNQTLGENVGNASSMISDDQAIELMFSRQVMDRILEVGGWLEINLSKESLEELKKDIRARSKVDVTGNLLRISYEDQDPRRAFLVASEFAEQFIRQSAAASRRESEDVYDFVDMQVKEYHKKLTQAEESLKDFRTSVVDASPQNKQQVFSLIENLESNLRATRLELREALIRKNSLEEQIQEESSRPSASSTAELYRRNLQEMRDELAILQLSYLDTYPDIISKKKQIQDMTTAIRQEQERHSSRQSSNRRVNNENYSELYQTLRTTLSTVKTEINTFKTRITQYEATLAEEKERANKMSEGEAREAELVRDYTVNQEFYQNLLRRRENARVSMNLALQESGLSFKIQEKANLPLIPTGLRFLHFVLIGPLLGLAIPLGVIVMLVQLDPRVRSRASIEDELELPLLMEFPPMNNSLALTKGNYSTIIVAVMSVAVFYAIVIGVQLAQSDVAPLFGGVSS